MPARYVKPKDLMEWYSISRSQVTKIMKEMIDSGRYPPNAIIGGPRCKRINPKCFADYFENMEWLRHPNMRKYVKPYKGG